VPITSALSERPPAPRPTHRSATTAIGLVTVGLASLLAAGGGNPVLLSIGTVATVAGVLVLSPIAIRALAQLARPFPVAVRVAVRDLARYRARSGVALAAVSLSLGVPVAIVVVASAADARAELGNVAPDQLLVWTRDDTQPEGESPFYTEDPSDEGFAPYLPDLTSADLTTMRTAIEEAADDLDAATVPLEVVVDPRVDDPDGRRAVTLARPTDIGYLDVALLYLATPELLAHYDIDLDDLGPDVDIVTTAPEGPSEIVTDTSQLWLSNMSTPPLLAQDVLEVPASYSSLPASFITADAARARGWTTTTVGWLVRSETPFTDDQVAAVRETAADNGLLVEQRRQRASLVTLRWGATGAGMAIALTVLAMTVGIIRAEAARDVRVLSATGATSTIRRTLTASTAGALAALGALLGTLGAYLALAAGYVGDTSDLAPVPLAHLAVIIVGVPLAATVTGWIVAAREPASLARPPLE
jgi:putative ABC transport system permease protein